MENHKTWRWGVNRWFILLFIILSVLAARAYPPVRPEVRLPAEHLSHAPLFTLPVIGDFYWTNTLTAMVIADILILIIAFVVRRATTGGSLMTTGFAAAVEALLEVLYNLTESTAGRYARKIFPYFATITIFVLIVNWMELLPGVDSIGLIEHAEGEGYAVKQLAPGIATLVKDAGQYTLVAYVRVLSTDLNFTVALALISVVMTQVIGISALGGSYFAKFFNAGGIFSKPVFGLIDFLVGLLEIVSEISKVLSFSFRLFGNLFAGTVLLFVIGYLVPVFAQSGVLLLEFFVGLIQAVIFGMLTMVFMAQATQGHGEHGEEATLKA